MRGTDICYLQDRGIYCAFQSFFSPPPLYKKPFSFPNFSEACGADTIPRPKGSSHLRGSGGPWSHGKFFEKKSLKWCFFRAILNILEEILLHVIHCTLIHPFYPFSPLNDEYQLFMYLNDISTTFQVLTIFFAPQP